MANGGSFSGGVNALSLAASQLERMRAMQYAYHRKFFNMLFLSSGVFLILWLWGGRPGVLWIPFLVVTAGFQSSFYLYFCDFARTHAARLEGWINRETGRRILNGGHLEDLYFYPLSEAKLSGFSLPAPRRFFSIFTLHWITLWFGVAVASVIHGWPVLSAPWNAVYLLGVGLWGGLNVGYLAWFFIGARDRRAMDQYLEENLGRPVEEQS